MFEQLIIKISTLNGIYLMISIDLDVVYYNRAYEEISKK